MTAPKGLTDDEVSALEAPAKGMTDDEVEQLAAPAERFTTGPTTKEKALENVLTFFGNGGPTAIMKGAQSAMAWPHPASGRRVDEGPIDLYRRVRDDTKRTLGSAEKHGPQVSLDIPRVGPVKFNPVAMAGAAAPSLFAPNPVSLAGRLAMGGFLGGTQAGIQSDADLTRGEFPQFMKDSGKGALFGVGASGIAEGITAPMRAIARGGAERIGGVVANKAAKDAADVAQEISSLEGKLGAESTKMSTLDKNATRAMEGVTVPLAGTTAIDPALQQRALLMLTDPITKRLREKVITNSLTRMPNQANVVEGLEQQVAARSAGASAEAAKRTSDFFAKPTFTTDVLPRIGRQLQNAAVGTAAALPAAAGFGAASGKAGAIGALLAGAGTGLAKGALSSARTTAANPRLQVGGLEALIRASQASQKAAQAGARTAAAGASQVEGGQTPVDQDEEDAIQAFRSGG